MYSVSSRYAELVQDTARIWDLYIDVTLRNGKRLRLTKSDIDVGSVVLKEGATCSDTIQVGSTYSNSFEFRLINKDNQYTELDFYLAKLWPFVGLDLTGDDDYEYVPLGEFNILDNVKKFSTISITCFDNMSLLNKPFDFSTLVFPIEAGALFDELINQCGIPVADSIKAQVHSLSYEVSSLLTNDPTCRDILDGFGIMLLKNLRFNRLGGLEAFWYTNTTKTTTVHTRVGNSSYGDNLITPTGVYLEDAYGNTFSVGTEQYAVALPTSPLIQGSKMAQPILNAALALFEALPYRPSTVTYIGDPAVQAGDVLTHHATAVGDLQLPVMRQVYKFAGTGTLESLGLDNLTNSQQTSTDRKAKKAFDRANKDKADLESKIDQSADRILLQVSKTYATTEQLGKAETDLKAAIDQSAGTILLQVSETYATTEQLGKDKTELESKIEQSANAVTIQASQRFADKSDVSSLSVKVDGISGEVSKQLETIEGIQKDIVQVQQTSKDFTVAIQSIVDNGVDKVTTKVSKDTLDDEGLKIAKSGEEMSNKLDNTGMYITRSGETMLQANNEGVVATDVKVRNYLVIGNYARFEDYNDGTDSRRTACFAVTD